MSKKHTRIPLAPHYRPMLAAQRPPKKIRFPLLAQRKYDGVRGITVRCRTPSLCGKATRVLMVSRDGVVFPNESLQNFAQTLPDGLDGEITCGSTFEDAQSFVMSAHSHDNFFYNIFDATNVAGEYATRLGVISRALQGTQPINPRCRLVPSETVLSPADLTNVYNRAIADGAEGLILRDPEGYYRNGKRATATSHAMFKMKPSDDMEATVYNWHHTTHKDGSIDSSLAGSITCMSYPFGTTDARFFNVSSGLTQALRRAIATDFAEVFKDRTVKISYSGLTVHGLPRHPVFIGFREIGT